MKNKSIDITISDDRMNAYLTINNSDKNFPTEEDIINELAAKNVTHGIKNSVIKGVVEKQEQTNSIKIAEGEPPQKGKDGKLVWYVKSDQEYTPSIDNDGKADFWSHKKLSQVEKGDEIVTKLPPTKGTPGKTVTGDVVVDKEDDIALPKGENVIVSEDGLTLRAKIGGHLVYKNGKVSISRTYKINGDVDFSTGDIKYNGKVHITGDVRSGFKVEAEDSIIIEGNVEASHIYSRNGDIHIYLGIVGKGRANILAGGNLHCGFIQAAKVNVSKNIFIEHHAINSEIYASKKIVAKRNEGLLRGGKIYSEEGIQSLEIGSEKQVPTEIGIDFNFPEFNIKIQELSQQIKDKESALKLVTKKIKFLNLLNDRIDELSDEKEEEYKNLLFKAKDTQKELESLKEKKDTLLSKSDKNFRKKTIEIENTIHRGVEINLGKLQFQLDQDYKNIRIFRDATNISIQKLSL